MPNSSLINDDFAAQANHRPMAELPPTTDLRRQMMPKGSSRRNTTFEEGIYLELRPVITGGLKMFDNKHVYLVYRDAHGNEEVIRGGPEGAPPYGDIQVQVGIPLQQSKDAYGPDESAATRLRNKVKLDGRDPQGYRI